VKICAAGVAVFFVADTVVGEASLPDGELRSEAMGEAAFDHAYGPFERDDLWRKDEVDVIGHDDEGVEFVMAFVAVALEGFEEEFGVGRDLEETAAVVGRGGDEECAGA
jgi:hypothetical protein